MSNSLSGQELNGYVIGPLIGGGGMGEVYQAFAPDRSPVALKVLRSEYAFEPDLQARFVREIRLMQAAQHENIIPILDYGSSGGMLYFVMKLINGATLSHLMKRRRFSPLDTWKVFKPIAQALHFIHTKGIVHRDVKPSNVFIERQSEGWHVYLGDLGLGKDLNNDNNLTAAGARLGTHEYMSLEAAMGQELDHRTDVYSLAVMAYEMLLGTLPVKPNSKGEVTIPILLRPIALPMELNPKFPLPLQPALMRGLEKEREARYQTVMEFAEAFHKGLSQLSEERLTTDYWVEE